jgi:hypothetical protein
VAFNLLDPITQGNIIVDHLASRQCKTTRDILQTPNIPWVPYLQGTIIGGKVERRLLTDIYEQHLRQFWTKKFGIPQAQSYDWQSFFQSISTLPAHTRHHTLKFNARILPVGVNLKRRRHSDLDNCPCCNQVEDHTHIYQCSHDAIEGAFTEHLDSVRDYLATHTAPALRHGVLFLIHVFRYGMDHGLPQHHGPLTLAQYHLGIHTFLAGLWLPEWKGLQSIYFSEHNLQKSVDLWFNRLMHLIQAFPSIMWATRNNILHTSRDNHVIQAQHRDLDDAIDRIFSTLPSQRIMAHCDITYFRRYDKLRLKAMTIQRKTNWVTGANLILTKYDNLPPQSKRFLSYFQWDPG